MGVKRYHHKVLNILAMKNYKQVRCEIPGKFIKIQDAVVDNNFYKELKAKYPGLAKYKDSMIRRCIVNFHKAIAGAVVDNRDGVSLPEHMGNLIVVSADTKKHKRCRPVDWNSTRKAKKRIRHTNMHSGGYKGSVKYITMLERYKFTNCMYWGFKSDANMSRLICNAYRTDWKRFIIAPNHRYIQNFIRQYYDEQNRRVTEQKQKGKDLLDNQHITMPG